MSASETARFAATIATLGRGPGRSRALSREEAREAFGMVLRGEADPHQVGAFLMLLRYRGEDPDEITGLVEAARAGFGGALSGAADLDWPSYGAGRTRDLPWFLLAALALARAGVRVLMHGSNEFAAGVSVEEGLAALGLSPALELAGAARVLDVERFAFLPVARLSPEMARLLAMRALFGLRSPVNTAARLLDPAGAPAGIDGVFHPAYIDVHLGVAERMRRPRLLVLKGGGGEAERNPAKPLTAHLWDWAAGRRQMLFPARHAISARFPRASDPGLLRGVWRGEAEPPLALSIVTATIATALVATGRCENPAAADDAADAIWRARL
ncbi:MAG: glycosyl transferase family protein [Acetobacteraceae bacterium]|nr:glycosyl transferase family protein [Acetobacteraceae bacterium]